MISRLTKIQLVIFAIVTVLGGAFVGGRYAQVDRLVVDRSFPVSAQFKDSGGIFAGAQVTYRGIPVGKVGKLTFKDDGVQATLDIENDAPKIPADVLAVVANKSAIGEQFVDLQPRTNSAPYLRKGSAIALKDTRIPIDTTTLLVDINNLVSSVNTDSLRTVVDELGQAFEGTGQDLSTILDTSSEFIQAADDNIDVTRALINDSSSVLQTQIDKQGELGTFSKNLALLSDSLVEADPDLRRLFDKGSDSAATLERGRQRELRRPRQRDPRPRHRQQASVGERARACRRSSSSTPTWSRARSRCSTRCREPTDYNAMFGLVCRRMPPPPTCTYDQNGGAASGYRERREEAVISDRAFETDLDCKVEPTTSRGSRARPSSMASALSAAQARRWRRHRETPSPTGKDSWKWLLLGPAQQ